MTLRIFFLLSLLLWSVMLESVLLMLALLLFSVFLLCCYGATAVLFVRSLRLLLWLFLPIILFHGLLTPGVYIQKPIYLPLSLEGLQHAFVLCLHILVMFFAALLVSRMVKLSEWFVFFNVLPGLGNILIPYLLLLPELRRITMAMLVKQRLRWLKIESKWLQFPDVFVQSMEILLDQGRQEARLLWLHWDRRVVVYTAAQAELLVCSRSDIAYGLLTVLGWSVLWIK